MSSKNVPAARDERAKLSEGDVVASKYRIDRELGEGGMGAVYAATNQLTKKRVAIKILLARYASDAAAIARFLREAQAAGRIHHPNVVDVYDVGQDGAMPFLVMELLHGRSLGSVMTAPFDPQSAVALLMPAMRGIAAAHAEGIVHRDLKPDNVFLCEDASGRIVDAKVLDFGISKAHTEEEKLTLTKTGAVMGTPHYMSLEQIRGMRDVDLRTDVYSLGVILYEAIGGALPFNANTFPALAVEIATAEVPPLKQHSPHIDPALEAVIMRAISRDRAQRYPDVPSLARALEPYANGVRFDERSAMNVALPPRPASSPRPVSDDAAFASTMNSDSADAPAPITGVRETARAKRSMLPLWIGGVAVIAIGAIALGWWVTRPEGASAPAAVEAEAPAPAPQVVAVPEPAPAPAPAPVIAPPAPVVPAEVVTPPAVPAVAVRPVPSPHPRPQPQTQPDVPTIEPAQPVRAGGIRTQGVSVDQF